MAISLLKNATRGDCLFFRQWSVSYIPNVHWAVGERVEKKGGFIQVPAIEKDSRCHF
jgi:hypothetical protein